MTTVCCRSVPAQRPLLECLEGLIDNPWCPALRIPSSPLLKPGVLTFCIVCLARALVSALQELRHPAKAPQRVVCCRMPEHPAATIRFVLCLATAIFPARKPGGCTGSEVWAQGRRCLRLMQQTHQSNPRPSTSDLAPIALTILYRCSACTQAAYGCCAPSPVMQELEEGLRRDLNATKAALTICLSNVGNAMGTELGR